MTHPNEIEKLRQQFELLKKEELIAITRKHYSDHPQAVAANKVLDEIREKEAIERHVKSLRWSVIAGIAAIAACIIPIVTTYILPPDKAGKGSKIQEPSQQKKATKSETREKNSLNTSALQRTLSTSTRKKKD